MALIPIVERHLPTIATAAILLGMLAILAISLAICVHLILSASQQPPPKIRRKGSPTHVLVVLGSGGHTAEMLSMLRRMPLDPSTYSYRTYIVTSGDSFSASKAADFETSLQVQYRSNSSAALGCYEVLTVPRARRVHQSYLTAPLSTIQCFWVCLQVLRGRHPDQRLSNTRSTTSAYPDLILTNGPATAVCVVLGAKLLRFSGALRTLIPFTTDQSATTGHNLRTIFVESWARVTTLSLSGKILLPFVDRFLVQWPNLAGKRAWRGMRKAEYIGTVIE